MPYPSPFEIGQDKDIGSALNLSLILIASLILMILLSLNGCKNDTELTQNSVNFKISNNENSVKLDGNDLNFNYKGLECGAQLNLKPSEGGLIIESNVYLSDDKIIISKGLMSGLICNQEVKCDGRYCKAGNYEIDLDPLIQEINKIEPVHPLLDVERNVIGIDGKTVNRYHIFNEAIYTNSSGKLIKKENSDSLINDTWNGKKIFSVVKIEDDPDFDIIIDDFNSTAIDYRVKVLNSTILNSTIPIKINGITQENVILDKNEIEKHDLK